MDYLHYNPVKHGQVSKVKDWSYSSFHPLVKAQLYPAELSECAGDLQAGERG